MTPEEKVRQNLVNALNADFVGPFISDGLPGGGQEVLPLPPSRWYLTGFLAPQGVGRRNRMTTKPKEISPRGARARPRMRRRRSRIWIVPSWSQPSVITTTWPFFKERP